MIARSIAALVSRRPWRRSADATRARIRSFRRCRRARRCRLKRRRAGITRFSFITYGDTRGRHDGVDLQAEHTLVIESMLAHDQDERQAPPIRSGSSCRAATRFRTAASRSSSTVSYIPLINRLTQDGGVPYFLSVGNHDVGKRQGLRRIRAASRGCATTSRRTRD